MDALRQTYRFIESYQARRGIAPTEREIGAAFALPKAQDGGVRLAEMWRHQDDCA